MSGLAAGMAAAASTLYGAAVAGRNRLYDRGLLRPEVALLPVVSIGNVTVGGTGKTPVVLLLAQRLLAAGTPVGILSRGYGRTATAPRLVLPGEPLPGPDEIGDEPWLLRTRLPALALGIDPRRARAAQALAPHLPRGLLLLDDGFQHRGLKRDLDVVVVAAGDAPLARARLLPQGRLREPISALGRADHVVMVDLPAPGVGERALLALAREVGACAPRAPLAHARPVLRGFRPLGETELLSAADLPRPVAAVAGIARPERLTATLASAGIPVAGTAFFRDHHRFVPPDRAPIAAAGRGARALVTTEKDEPRLLAARPAVVPLDRPVFVAVLDLELVSGEEALVAAAARCVRAPEY
jgi:tetraacyldisaccharide 4'-kinase